MRKPRDIGAKYRKGGGRWGENPKPTEILRENTSVCRTEEKKERINVGEQLRAEEKGEYDRERKSQEVAKPRGVQTLRNKGGLSRGCCPQTPGSWGES